MRDVGRVRSKMCEVLTNEPMNLVDPSSDNMKITYSLLAILGR